MSIGSKTSTVTINAAFLQEIKEVNSDMWDLLDSVKKLCSAPQHVEYQGRQVVEALAELRDKLAMHFALEEAYGYFNDPVSVAPQLCQSCALSASALANSISKDDEVCLIKPSTVSRLHAMGHVCLFSCKHAALSSAVANLRLVKLL